ncbi:unnamed protein product [Schistosoma turkestanicum]|nr:unnamed protein product [Schistosoma turkestanicum]
MSSTMGVSALVSNDTNPYFSGLLRHHGSDCVTERVGYRETSYNSVNVSPTHNVSHSPLISHSSSKDSLPTCAGCRRTITDQYLYRIQGLAWHESCAICSVCSAELVEVCFIVNKNELLCHRDYDRLYATKCANCRQPMRSHELFMRAKHPTSVKNSLDSKLSSLNQELIFHVSCFTCCICQQPIAAGEAYIIDPVSRRPICHSDFLTKQQRQQSSPLLLQQPNHHQSSTTLYPVRTNNRQSSDPKSCTSSSSSPRNWRQFNENTEHIHQSSSNYCLTNQQNDYDDMELTSHKNDWPTTVNQDLDQSYQSFSSGGFSLSRRIRTSLTDEQRYRLQEAYELNIRPSKSIREALASELGVPMRVVQVWFQNQRARDKRASAFGHLNPNTDNSSVTHMNTINPHQFDSHQLHLNEQQRNHCDKQQSSDLCPFTPSPHTSIESGPFPEFGGFSSDNLVRYVSNDVHNDSTDVQQSWRSVSHAVWLVDNENENSTVR